MMSNAIVMALAPVFFVLLLGYAAGKFHIVDNHHVDGFNALVMDFALPASLFAATASASRSQMIEQAPLFLVFGLTMLILYAAWYWGAACVFRRLKVRCIAAGTDDRLSESGRRRPADRRFRTGADRHGPGSRRTCLRLDPHQSAYLDHCRNEHQQGAWRRNLRQANSDGRSTCADQADRCGACSWYPAFTERSEARCARRCMPFADRKCRRRRRLVPDRPDPVGAVVPARLEGRCRNGGVGRHSAAVGRCGRLLLPDFFGGGEDGDPARRRAVGLLRHPVCRELSAGLCHGGFHGYCEHRLQHRDDGDRHCRALSH